MKKNVLIVGIVLVVVVLIAMALRTDLTQSDILETPISESTVSDEWKTYQNAEWGVSFNYPPEWFLEDDSEENKFRVKMYSSSTWARLKEALDSGAEIAPSADISIAIYNASDFYKKFSYEDFDGYLSSKEYYAHEKGKVSFNGHDVWMFVDGAPGFFFQTYTWVTGDTFYEISTTFGGAYESSQTEPNAIKKQILSTIVIN